MKRQRISAFTLFEIVFSMMLVGLVIGMAYTAFTLFTKIYRDYHDKNLSHADVQIVRRMIDEDVEKASLIFLTDSQVYFNGIGEDSADLHYDLHPDYFIRRTEGAQDTFRMKSLALIASFEAVDVSNGIVDHLIFKFEFEGAPMLISTKKRYTAEDLFNYTDTLWNQ
ncbi:MAG: hypothetical protein EOP48_09750 [Sphingobacteriales bacterium]|nr:MAG: hypothetical protein EOP48_09750 [Sphingobacteriales bacterium]